MMGKLCWLPGLAGDWAGFPSPDQQPVVVSELCTEMKRTLGWCCGQGWGSKQLCRDAGWLCGCFCLVLCLSSVAVRQETLYLKCSFCELTNSVPRLALQHSCFVNWLLPSVLSGHSQKRKGDRSTFKSSQNWRQQILHHSNPYEARAKDQGGNTLQLPLTGPIHWQLCRSFTLLPLIRSYQCQGVDQNSDL